MSVLGVCPPPSVTKRTRSPPPPHSPYSLNIQQHPPLLPPIFWLLRLTPPSPRRPEAGSLPPCLPRHRHERRPTLTAVQLTSRGTRRRDLTLSPGGPTRLCRAPRGLSWCRRELVDAQAAQRERKGEGSDEAMREGGDRGSRGEAGNLVGAPPPLPFLCSPTHPFEPPALPPTHDLVQPLLNIKALSVTS